MTPTIPAPPSPFRAFAALFFFSLGRHAQVRQLGYVAFGLLAILTLVVGVVSQGKVGWRLENRTRYVASFKNPEQPTQMSYTQYGEERLPFYHMMPGSPDAFAARAIAFAPYWSMINAVENEKARKFLDDWAFLNFSRWVVFALFLAFLMPLFTLAYATGSMGTERESRTMIWLTTKPLPRWAIYLAKYLATLPWALAVSGIAFIALCLAGGEMGRRAAMLYWPSVLVATIAFASLFHLVGAVFRRPAVVGLVYIFFFETLVSNLPGSLKQLSLNYYVRSLFYNATSRAIETVQPESVDVYAPADSATAWAVLLGVAVLLTLLGMYLFGRLEPKDET